jgi:hypothetical protein
MAAPGNAEVVSAQPHRPRSRRREVWERTAAFKKMREWNNIEENISLMECRHFRA